MRERFQLTSPFILYTGNIKPHKNVDRLIEAYSMLRPRGFEDVKLLIIGDEISKYPNLRRLVHRFQLHQHVRFLGFVPDETLAVLYRLASVFVFPSLYEGFGLPPLEAMAAGTPVITSNVSSLPEVVGDAALLIDPMDAGAIADAMAACWATTRSARDLIRRGRERVKAFSWERSVARVREVYAELAGPGRMPERRRPHAAVGRPARRARPRLAHRHARRREGARVALPALSGRRPAARWSISPGSVSPLIERDESGRRSSSGCRSPRASTGTTCRCSRRRSNGSTWTTRTW